MKSKEASCLSLAFCSELLLSQHFPYSLRRAVLFRWEGRSCVKPQASMGSFFGWHSYSFAEWLRFLPFLSERKGGLISIFIWKNQWIQK